MLFVLSPGLADVAGHHAPVADAHDDQHWHGSSDATGEWLDDYVDDELYSCMAGWLDDSVSLTMNDWVVGWLNGCMAGWLI